MNKYFRLLQDITDHGMWQRAKKGDSIFLLNQVLSMNKYDLEQIFSEYSVAKKLLEHELHLYMQGEIAVAHYKEKGIHWWDYAGKTMVNTYPTYMKKLPALINKINAEKRPSKNYVLFLGETGKPTSQLPCLSLFQFQIVQDELYITVYQRSADSNLGLPSDIYQTMLIADMIDVPLANITFFIGNAHIYRSNYEKTKELLATGIKPKFELNV